MAKGKPLDLDELYGKNEPVIVRFGGREYELYRHDSWTPQTYGRYIALQKRLTVAELETATEDPEAFAKLAAVLAEILAIISPELAALNLSMEKQSAIVRHWQENVFPDALEDAEPHLKNRIGA